MKRRPSPWRRALRTLGLRIGRRSDARHWSDLAHHDPEWDERTRLIAGLVPPGSRVLEFGAGRGQLRGELDPSCAWVGSDLAPRDADTIVCDLNRRPLPAPSAMSGPHDVVVLGGVLEYLHDLRSFVPWLATLAPTCIASYEVARTEPGRRGRRREAIWRASIGWVNTFSEREFLALFAASGYEVRDRVLWETPSGDEPIFVFVRPDSPGASR